MNALVFAQHHGAFLTLQSLLGKATRIICVVPQTQIDKYKGFPEKEFQEYRENMVAYCKKHKIELYISPEPVTPLLAQQIVTEKEGHGAWAVLTAGAIFQSSPDMQLLMVAAVNGRMFDKIKHLAMYHMIGEEPKNELWHVSNFFMNADLFKKGAANAFTRAEEKGRLMAMGAHSIQRPDVLIGTALSGYELARFRTKSNTANVLNFWMQAIKPDRPEAEYLAYPLDEYAKLAKKVSKYLPPAALEAILENGAESAKWRAFGDLSV